MKDQCQAKKRRTQVQSVVHLLPPRAYRRDLKWWNILRTYTIAARGWHTSIKVWKEGYLLEVAYISTLLKMRLTGLSPPRTHSPGTALPWTAPLAPFGTCSETRDKRCKMPEAIDALQGVTGSRAGFRRVRSTIYTAEACQRKSCNGILYMYIGGISRLLLRTSRHLRG